MVRSAKYALKACKIARETVKLALIRRDNRRTHPPESLSIDPEIAGKPEFIGN
jgi:hypothetical protein